MKNFQNSKSILLSGYTTYLKDVRQLKDSSVKHYLDALKYASKELKVYDLVKDDIYEIRDIDKLNYARNFLFSLPSFIEVNERGNHMYSTGLNHYVSFCEGNGLNKYSAQLSDFDSPMDKLNTTMQTSIVHPRSDILRRQSLVMADYQCQVDSNHHTFIAKATNHPYMESHHLIPLKYQDKFDYSLDVYANIICLCPICHRRLHYALDDDKANVARQLFLQRADHLYLCGLTITEQEFLCLIQSQ